MHLSQDEMDDMLESDPVMGGLYQQLVPKQLTDEEFWTHYFYRLHLLNARAPKLLAAFERNRVEQDNLGWSDDDEPSETPVSDTQFALGLTR